MRSTFDNTLQTSYGDRVYGFIRCTDVVPERVHCNNCGYTLSFMFHKKQICPNCLQYVYPTKRDEFKDKLKIKIKEKEQKHE